MLTFVVSTTQKLIHTSSAQVNRITQYSNSLKQIDNPWEAIVSIQLDFTWGCPQWVQELWLRRWMTAAKNLLEGLEARLSNAFTCLQRLSFHCAKPHTNLEIIIANLTKHTSSDLKFWCCNLWANVTCNHTIVLSKAESKYSSVYKLPVRNWLNTDSLVKYYHGSVWSIIWSLVQWCYDQKLML